METQIFTKENLDIAAKALQQGEIVSFPTETVYGLGAIATSQEAVLKVFKAKGRPSDNPLIVHISDIQQMTSTVEEIPEIALTLAKAFWPGPLTMILKAKPGIYAPALSAGLPTVSFRMPNHPLTLELITKVGIPLVGPSANLSTKPSPTKVEHVFEDMNGRIRGILDGGSSTVGVESTVIDLTNEEGPVILRPGVITKEQIESVIGPIQSSVTTKTGEREVPKSPGMKYRHYAPKTPVLVVEGTVESFTKAIQEAQNNRKTVGIMAQNAIVDAFERRVKGIYKMGTNVDAMNRSLFDALRTLDHLELDIILAQSAPEEGVGIAYMNRLKKAASTVL
ncbi:MULTISPECIES: L-threonylcarbamoyladenylate synthase [Granulicatella]|jgi:sua5/yciO/yrdC/ywlC family protein|uniref:L-threonylcarbamoyladenylate synthase n=1 Tax=Granulicatella TaxID=117563 RepID=UPI00066DE3AF|nr:MULTISPECIES: L-threonylcarbamoyladenylate synthase [Granulicatella]MCT2161218.1 L-threonylcarbamoyladenylate synthase [Granulicatella adiacens]OFT02229.1 translation factor Sua5 [Granulicatella sp. HMSC31F03]